ncbi:hypothetical protein FisN_6Hu253 [Fistulifera solaris]|uniref:Uncharacterized protein n=1 Tax=Fistulifera solaris TaxID=1519565 RepID=A0A1Z5K6Y7_FISSO|nr:hypothetical protein FisN_6Hu253 [Fistulifera solaris]|eukprot:GAX22007.1 hypothetical protein FisN_6Hu253 [Fistulifera solaris]
MAAKKPEEDYEPFKCTPNMAKICRFLITEHADLVRKQVRGHGRLPIHKLAHRCNRTLVQQMTILLLKSFPECVQVLTDKRVPSLLSIPFIQQVHPLIVNELEIDEEASLLAQMVRNFETAAYLSKHSSSNSSLLDSVVDVFSSWSNVRVSDDLSAQKRHTQLKIAITCRLMKGNDVSNDEWEDDDDDFDESSSESESEEEDDYYDEYNRSAGDYIFEKVFFGGIRDGDDWDSDSRCRSEDEEGNDSDEESESSSTGEEEEGDPDETH